MKGYGFFFVCPTLTRNRNAAAKSSFPAQTVAKRLGFTSNIFAMKGQVKYHKQLKQASNAPIGTIRLCFKPVRCNSYFIQVLSAEKLE